MDWENELYVRLYVRETTTWRMLGWEAQALFPQILRVVDRAGVLDCSEVGVADALALQLPKWPVSVIKSGVADLELRRVIELTSQALVVPNFIEAQEAKKSDTQRKREYRAKRRALSRGVPPPSQNVPSVSHGSVTGGQNVPPSLAELSLAELSVAELADEKPPLAKSVVDLASDASVIHEQVKEKIAWSAPLRALSLRAPRQDKILEHLGQGRKSEDVRRALLDLLDRVASGVTDKGHWGSLWGAKGEAMMAKELGEWESGEPSKPADPTIDDFDAAWQYAQEHGRAPSNWRWTTDAQGRKTIEPARASA